MRLRWKVYIYLWRALQAAFFVATVAMAIPRERLAQLVGEAAANWMQWPPVLVPFVALSAAIVLYEWFDWLHTRQTKKLTAPERNWPVRDLFTYLHSEAALVYDFEDERVWVDAAQERVQHLLADPDHGLASWGRPARSPERRDDLLQFRKITPEYWVDHELDLVSCLDDTCPFPARTDAVLNRSDPLFDLHVNKEQARARFPRAPWLKRKLLPHSFLRDGWSTEITETERVRRYVSLDGNARATVREPREDVPS